MYEDRQSVVDSLVNFSESPSSLAKKLALYPWDLDEPLIMLTEKHVRSALTRFIRGDLVDRDISDWAELMEVRDDISFENESIASFLTQAANPLLEGPLSLIWATGWLKRLDPAAPN